MYSIAIRELNTGKKPSVGHRLKGVSPIYREYLKYPDCGTVYVVPYRIGSKRRHVTDIILTGRPTHFGLVTNTENRKETATFLYDERRKVLNLKYKLDLFFNPIFFYSFIETFNIGIPVPHTPFNPFQKTNF